MIISSDKLIVRGSFVFYSTFKINIYLGLKEFCSKQFFSQKNFGSKLYLVSKFYFWFSVKCISRSNTFLSQILFFGRNFWSKCFLGQQTFGVEPKNDVIRNTSLAVPGALAQCLQCCTACKIQNGRRGLERCQTPSLWLF